MTDKAINSILIDRSILEFDINFYDSCLIEQITIEEQINYEI